MISTLQYLVDAFFLWQVIVSAVIVLPLQCQCTSVMGTNGAYNVSGCINMDNSNEKKQSSNLLSRSGSVG